MSRYAISALNAGEKQRKKWKENAIKKKIVAVY